MPGAYESLLAVAHNWRLPRHFLRDLTVHDARYCSGRGERVEFLWYLYASGTHLVELSPAARYPVAKLVEQIGRDFAEDGHWFHWDTVALVGITIDRAIELAREAEEK